MPEQKTKGTWGGARPNSGPKKGPETKIVKVLLEPHDAELFKSLGGSKWLRTQLKKERIMNDTQKLFVFDWTRGKHRMTFYTESKDDFMNSHGIEGACDGDYEKWRGTDGLDDVQDCLSKEEALGFLKDIFEDGQIDAEQYDELLAEVKAA